jgi:hypothetical protein
MKNFKFYFKKTLSLDEGQIENLKIPAISLIFAT